MRRADISLHNSPVNKDSGRRLLAVRLPFSCNIISVNGVSSVRCDGGTYALGRWLRWGLWALFAVIGVGIVAAVVGFLWLRYIPPPTIPQSILLAPVSEVRATAGRGIISIDWTNVPNAICYP